MASIADVVNYLNKEYNAGFEEGPTGSDASDNHGNTILARGGNKYLFVRKGKKIGEFTHRNSARVADEFVRAIKRA